MNTWEIQRVAFAYWLDSLITVNQRVLERHFLTSEGL